MSSQDNVPSRDLREDKIFSPESIFEISKGKTLKNPKSNFNSNESNDIFEILTIQKQQESNHPPNNDFLNFEKSAKETKQTKLGMVIEEKKEVLSQSDDSSIVMDADLIKNSKPPEIMRESLLAIPPTKRNFRKNNSLNA